MSEHSIAVSKDNTEHECTNAQKQRQQPVSIPAEVARYRLAFLDAAQVADTIASARMAEEQDNAFVDRCRELAKQMREFAGHGSNPTDFNEQHKQPRTNGRALSRLLPKVWSR